MIVLIKETAVLYKGKNRFSSEFEVGYTTLYEYFSS